MKEKVETKKSNPLVTTIVVTAIVAVVAFFGGMKYQQTKLGAMGNPRTMQFGRNGQGGFGGQGSLPGSRNGGPTVGQITSIDDKSITVKLADGSSKLVFLNDTTSYSKTASGSKSDLTIGLEVGAFGMANSDGSITAQSIQLNPQFGRRAMPSASASAMPVSK